MRLLILTIISICLSFPETQAQAQNFDAYLSNKYPKSTGYQPRLTQPMRREIGRYNNQVRDEQQAADYYWHGVYRENQREIDNRRLNSTYPKYNNPYLDR